MPGTSCLSTQATPLFRGSEEGGRLGAFPTPPVRRPNCLRSGQSHVSLATRRTTYAARGSQVLPGFFGAPCILATSSRISSPPCVLNSPLLKGPSLLTTLRQVQKQTDLYVGSSETRLGAVRPLSSRRLFAGIKPAVLA